MDLHNILGELMDCSSSAAGAMQMRLSETERKAAAGERGKKIIKKDGSGDGEAGKVHVKVQGHLSP